MLRPFKSKFVTKIYVPLRTISFTNTYTWLHTVHTKYEIVINEKYFYVYCFHVGVCPMLLDPINGKVFLQGNTAFFVCFPGTAVMGVPILTCSNGNWNNPPPTCKLLNP